MAVSIAPWCGFVLPVEAASMGETTPPVEYKKFICSFPGCNAAYNRTWKLQAHMCKHTGERPFPCTYEGCGKGFITLFHLNRHILTHTGERPCKCEAENCSLAFTTPSNMRLHFKRAHASPAQVYVCNFADCGKEFRKHNRLRIHEFTHTNENPYKCPHEGCEKSYGSPSRLKRHEKVHAGYPCKKDNTCPFVGKTWTEYLKHIADVHSVQCHTIASDRLSEQSWHGGMQETSGCCEFTCDVCNRTFKKKQNLKDHKKTHQEETIVYRCPREDCERSYTKKCNLRNHILSFHEDLRPFVCEHEGCGKTFAVKQSLDRHFNTHDPEKKKMVKAKPRGPTRGLASRLSGFKPKKSKRSHSPSETPEPSQQPPEGSQQEPLLVLENLSLK